MATHKEEVPQVEVIGMWQVRHEGKMVMAVSWLLGDVPGGSIELPFPMAKGWGNAPIGNWFSAGEYGSIDCGHVRPTSHLDIVALFPVPTKPCKLVVWYER